jgi:hypothetical protein
MKIDIDSKKPKKIEEYKELSEKRLSQFLYEQNQFICQKKKYENLIGRYKNIRTDLYNKKRAHKGLLEKNILLKSDLYDGKNRVEELKKLNINLEILVKSYRSRKVVKIADMILKAYHTQKSHIIKIFNNKEAPSGIYSENKLHSEGFEKSEDIDQIASKPSSNTEPSKIKPKRLKDLKVAVILDEFSYNSFKYEFIALPIEPSNWLKIFQTEKPDLFLCESAWHGADSEKRPWKSKIDFNVNTKPENRGVLLDILKYCKENGITTIFWNKEDPTHYDDKVHSFVDTATKFDYIFTTAEECIPRYKEEYGLESVHSLMFAAQPILFNPIEKQERSEDIIFAGSWYAHHVQRCYEMIEIFDNILNSGYNLKIYDRVYYKHVDDSFRFPDKYNKFINPPVPHDQIEKVYKESKYSLNINTVTKSKTMFARRAFELMLCNTLVLSNYSKGLHNLFGDNVVFIGKNKIDLINSEEKRINNLYNVLENHTYSNRFKQILNTINYEYLPEDNTVTIYYCVKNESDIDKVLEHYKSIDYSPKKLVLILSNQTPDHLIERYANDNNLTVYPLNYLLNQLETISNTTPYFIFANLQLEKDFIEKAILHYSYIETKFGIALGDKFTFKNADNLENVLLTNENFMEAINNTIKNESTKFAVYTIKI